MSDNERISAGHDNGKRNDDDTGRKQVSVSPTGVQGDEALVVEVHQPPGGGDQDVHALLQGLHLGGLAHAAKDDGVAQLQVFAVLVEALLDL